MRIRLRLVRSTAAIALIAVLVLGIPLVVVETARVGTEQSFRLEREADVIAGLVDDRLQAGQAVTAAVLAPRVVAGHRVTVLVDGRRIVAGARLTGATRSSRASTAARTASVSVAAPRSEESARVRRTWLLIVLLGIGGVGVAVALAVLQARRLSRPLEDVAGTSARLGEGDFSARAPRSGVPEIDAIAEALDRSAAQIAHLVAREREFSANVSHQLRTPLTALRLRVEELALLDDAGQREAESAAALREADRLERTIAALLAHAREERAGRALRLDLARVAAEHVATWRPVYAQAGRPLALEAQPGVGVLASPGAVGQVLDVLLENALCHGAGAVAVRVTGEGGAAVLRVADDGPGVPVGAREAIFARGASGSGGSGIGLHLARALAEADGASLQVAPGPPACFELRLPLAGEVAAAVDAPAPAPAPAPV